MTDRHILDKVQLDNLPARDGCPLWSPGGLRDYPKCLITGKRCDFGLTENRVPTHCPLLKRQIRIKLVRPRKRVSND